MRRGRIIIHHGDFFLCKGVHIALGVLIGLGRQIMRIANIIVTWNISSMGHSHHRRGGWSVMSNVGE
jgi:hypothetical protein